MNRLTPLLPRLAPALAVALVLAACGEGKPPGGGFHGFPARRGRRCSPSQPKSIPVTFEYVGQALGSKEVEVRARVGGILDKRIFQEGAPVKAGQSLFLIDPKPFEAQAASAEADLARAQAQLAQAQRDAARLKPLAEKKAIGRRNTTTRCPPTSSPPPP